MLKLVINLDRSPDRWAHAKAQLDRVGVDAQRVQGVDGKLLTQDQLDHYNVPSNYPYKILCPRPLRAGEIGCFLSHQKCWEMLMRSEEKWALIMEDDIILSDRAPTYMNNEDWIPDDVDFVNLWIFFDTWTSLCKKQKIILKTGDELLWPISPAHIGAPAYIISRRAAEFALSLSERFPYPVDNFLFEWGPVAERFIPWCLNNPVVRTTGEPSTIHNNNKIRVRSPLSWQKIKFKTRREIAKAFAVKHEFKFF